MIIRSAVLEGTVPEAHRAAFDTAMRGSVRSAIGRYPGLHTVKLRWPAEAEAGAPPVYVVFDLYFDSLDAMHVALASAVRQEVRQSLGVVMQMFEGRVYHLIMHERD